MQQQFELAGLVSQLEAPKFARLMRFMANLPIPRDKLELQAMAYGLGETELLVRMFGHYGSLGSSAATWIYHQAFLPVGLWAEKSIVIHLKDRLTTAKRDLDSHPDADRMLCGSAQWTGNDVIPTATEAYYYLATNIAAPLSDGAMNAVRDHFRQHFGSEFAQFGFATPQSMAEAAPSQVRRVVLDLLNSPSSYYFVAREGQVSVVPVTEHGLYMTGTSGSMEAATATSSLSVRPPGITDLEALVGSLATSEADLQAFFTENPHFLLGLDDCYCEVRPHVVLTSPAGTKLVPDFMVRLEDPGRVALIELKKPSANILAGNREGGVVGRVAAQAIKQLMEYTDAVSTRSARAELIKSIGAAPFDPCLVVLIGRGSPNQREVWRGMRAGLPDVQLVTYDFLLERARIARALNEQSIPNK
ncbi:DUF4263 domain-containing protein [Rhizobium laguerreae]|uniref:Shedu anti-phage system protein SduA domain-containing protein n=1 Tax=Rhizobium laguerreae TaxID=1076926 RepID=UPI001C90CFD1|nr:Shedu anti-phage system protein SduA domain-containing protein [Rhizobium laguerreae]MBY3090183.1 DUF4263 domain-containing protein [Rhizobium laguerreae]